MAHKKGGGSSRNGRDSNPQMLGVKIYGGQTVERRHDPRPPARQQDHARARASGSAATTRCSRSSRAYVRYERVGKDGRRVSIGCTRKSSSAAPAQLRRFRAHRRARWARRPRFGLVSA